MNNIYLWKIRVMDQTRSISQGGRGGNTPLRLFLQQTFSFDWSPPPPALFGNVINGSENKKINQRLIEGKGITLFSPFLFVCVGFFFYSWWSPPPLPPLFKNVNGIKNYSPALKQPQLITAPQYLHVAMIMIQLSVVENIGD